MRSSFLLKFGVIVGYSYWALLIAQPGGLHCSPGLGFHYSFRQISCGGWGTSACLDLNFCTVTFFSAAVAPLHLVQLVPIIKFLRHNKRNVSYVSYTLGSMQF